MSYSEAETPGSKEELTEVLKHYTQWLEANNIIDITNLPAPQAENVAEGFETAFEECVEFVVGRYMELQWGEDLEEEWGHAFDT
jgi:hypothetical protein